jgi:molybdopterin molybdotransferase
VRTGLSPAEALETILDATRPLGAETVAARDALGRVLVEPVVSDRRLPPADNSAMDGYAVQSSDLAGAGPENRVWLQVVCEMAAGAEPSRSIGSGEAARIFTGAPIPPGADAVVRQEDTTRDGDRVEIRVATPAHDNVRDAGEDVQVGDAVLAAGTRLGSAQLGVLASLGRAVVSVHQRPRVAILSGGDELVEPDRGVAGGGIVSSNSYSLAAHCHEIGAEPLYLGIARDTPEDLERHFRAGLSGHVLVSSAGVSVGDRDYVRPVLEKLGCELVFWGVEMKPGYPLAFGRFPSSTGPLVFALPGNPVSALVTFEQFVRPALRKMMGHKSWYRPVVQARLAEPLRKKAGRLHFVRVLLERVEGVIVARATGNQGSGVLSSMTAAQGLLVFPADATELREGDTASVQVLDADFFESASPGF